MRHTLLVFSLIATPPVDAQVTTAQYGNARTGTTVVETTLTPANVNVRHFGKQFSLDVDGDVYAQPLYVPDVMIPGKGRHNVLYITTEHDGVFAYDADYGDAAPLWRVSFIDPDAHVTTVPPIDLACPFIRPEVGITATPAIDIRTGTLYVLARTKERGEFVQRLHALDMATGAEALGGPITIHAAAAGQTFDPRRENPRAALLLANDAIYLTWASSCDMGPYTGWIMAYNARTLAQTAVLDTAPDSGYTGIWQGDAGPAADSQGNIYVVTGNGPPAAADRGRDYSNSVLKLRLARESLVVQAAFTPPDQQALNAKDLDLGSSGPVLLPVHRLVIAGKGPGLYVIDSDRLGAKQTIVGPADCFGAPAYWNGHLYYACENDALQDFSVADGRVSVRAVARSSTTFTGVGAIPTVSANGSANGIVWVIATPNFFGKAGPAVLHAFDAANIAHELYTSEEDSTRDRAGIALHFGMPLVVNGRVYIGVRQHVDVYGLLAPSFAGQWTMDVANSDLGILFAPKTDTVTITQQGAQIGVLEVTTNEQGERTATPSSFTAGGSAGSATLIGLPFSVHGAMAWRGDNLEFDGGGASGAVEFTVHESWSLSPDAKRLTISRHLSSTQGTTDQTIILNR